VLVCNYTKQNILLIDGDKHSTIILSVIAPFTLHVLKAYCCTPCRHELLRVSMHTYCSVCVGLS